jgi:hypothetical protein
MKSGLSCELTVTPDRSVPRNPSLLRDKAGLLRNKAGLLRKIWQKTAKKGKKRPFFCVKKNEKHSKTGSKTGLKGPKNRVIFNVPDFLSV